LEIAAIRAVCAAASYAFSKPKGLDFNVNGDVIDLQFSYRPEFRERQSSFQFLDRYDERIFYAAFSFSQEIHLGLFWVCNDDFERDYAAFQSPERL
jgi:hypothetical protein